MAQTKSLLRAFFSLFIMLIPNQAKSSGKFSDEELQSLKREFQHHKEKVQEYNIFMDTVTRTEGELPLLHYQAGLSDYYFLFLLVYKHFNPVLLHVSLSLVLFEISHDLSLEPFYAILLLYFFYRRSYSAESRFL